MRVYITVADRALADDALLNETVENRRPAASESLSNDRREIVSTGSRANIAPLRVPVVVISDAMRQAVDNRLHEQSNGNRWLGNRQSPVPLPVGLPTTPLDQPRVSGAAGDVNVQPIVVQAPPIQPPRRRHAIVPLRVTYRQAMRQELVENLTTFGIGSSERPHSMTMKCAFCAAEFFAKETHRADGRFYLCCAFGKVNIPLLEECPPELRELYADDGHRNVVFRTNIRAANTMFAMASFKANVPTNRLVGQGHWCFHVSGQIYHFAENIPRHDGDNFQPNVAYNQFYFIDAQDAITRRSAFFGGVLDQGTVRVLEGMLRRVNPLVRSYMSMGEVIRQRRQEDFRRGIHPERSQPAEVFIAFMDRMAEHIRDAHELPAAHNEVAAVFVGDQPPRDVDLVIYERGPGNGNRSAELKNLNPLADPMVYPLLFSKGEQGFRMRTRVVARPRTLLERRGRKEPIIVDMHGDPAPLDLDIPAQDPVGVEIPRRNTRSRSYVTMRQFYRFRIMIRNPINDFDAEVAVPAAMFRPAEFSTLHNGGKLFQQYLVDAWVRVEADQLWYLKQHQEVLRKTNVSALRRHLEQRARGEHARIGKILVLPRTFLGGQRNMNRRYLDAMTTVARHGKPDLFITFTCNPSWQEIVQNLEHKQKFEHRPDLVCRVFHTKLLELINDIYIKQYFGVALNYMYSVEFQKRGLPHAHILLTLRHEDKLNDDQSVDAAIQAAFPNPREEPRLFQLIVRHMIHAPCGAHNLNSRCMKDGRCVKYFPKRFRETTDMVGDGQRINQPEYKRPQDGRGVDLRGIFVDNSWIVPFNRYLIAKYDCHINVECCGSLKSIKYLHKYVNKGPDYCQVQMANAQRADAASQGQRVINWDEIQHYQDHRYVSSMEATWRLLEYVLSDRSHSVLVLPVHLPGQREVIFDEEAQAEDLARELDDGRKSKLEAWFELNGENPDARAFKYQYVPEHFTWNDGRCTWQPRRQMSKTLGCIAEVSPENGELFYLRMLLGHVRGALSFEYLRTVNGVLHDTYLSACRALNLLYNVDEYDRCLREARETRAPNRLRVLFALIACEMRNNNMDPVRITDLWNRYRDDLILDFVEQGNSQETAVLKALFFIKRAVTESSLGGDAVTMAQLGLPDVDLDDPALREDIGGRASQNFGDDDVHDDGRANSPVHNTLNRGQLAVFNEVMEAVDMYINQGPLNQGNLFFLDGPGGTGKTYLYNIILNEVRERFGRSCLPVAWTGIAATLLRGGRTVHSTFRLPLNLTDLTVAGFPLDSDRSQIIREAVAVLWDEAPMTPRNAVQAVDRYLQVLMNRPGRPFGGKVVLFGGDFRQLLPVIPRAHTGQVINASIFTWPFWGQVAVRRLTQNLRVQRSTDGDLQGNQEYAAFLLQIGDGTAPTRAAPTRPGQSNLIELPRRSVVEDPEDLIDFVYGPRGRIAESLESSAADLAILCPTNRAVDEINTSVQDRLAGEATTYFSVDQYMGTGEGDDDLHVPEDLLHSVNTAGLGPHELTLKVGAVVMLVRNIDLSRGLCNGTRLQVLTLGEHMLELKTLTGGIEDHRGRVVYLPKMHLTASPSSGTNLPGKMRRLQFPIRLAFALTINKSQGQTFKRVGVYLNTPCFAHGQLYVALSRVGSLNSLRVCVRNSTAQGSFAYRDGRKFTPNVVIPQIVAQGRPVEPTQSQRGRDRHFISRQTPNETLRVVSEGSMGASIDNGIDTVEGLSQFYVDDWSQQFVAEIDRCIANAGVDRAAINRTDCCFDSARPPQDRQESATSALEQNDCDVPEPWILPDTDFPLLDPSNAVDISAVLDRSRRVGKGKRPLQRQTTTNMALDRDDRDNWRYKRPRVTKEDPRLPHIQAPPRLAAGDEPGTSGLRDIRPNWEHSYPTDLRADFDSDSD